jgi:hypothetical protein
MVHSLDLITGASILATDGEMGTVGNFLFEDVSWMIRYLVVDCGSWLARRRVLIAVTAVDQPDWGQKVFRVHLTKEQIRHGPDIDTARPVSRQQEIAMSRYFGWPTYWSVRIPDVRYTTEMEYPSADPGDPHLRSVWDIAGYEVWALDGEVGHLDDFIMDEAGWHIGYLVVNTGDWLNRRQLVISARSVKSISWANRRVNLLAEREKIQPDFESWLPAR